MPLGFQIRVGNQLYGGHNMPPLRSEAASGWAGWTLAHPEFGVSVNIEPVKFSTISKLTLFQPGGQIMPIALLLAHPDFKT